MGNSAGPIRCRFGPRRLATIMGRPQRFRYFRHLTFIERVPEFRFLILDLRTKIFSEFGNETLLPLRLRQPEAHRLQITIHEFRWVLEFAHIRAS